MINLKTRSLVQTQQLAQILAREIKSWLGKRPLILALEGELGSGKTTFAQGLAGALGIREKVLSPTFVLLKVYKLPALGRPAPLKSRAFELRAGLAGKKFRHLIHIDCYRLDSPQDLIQLGFKDLLKDQDAVLMIEWADRIKSLLPKNILRIKFKHEKNPQERTIKFLV